MSIFSWIRAGSEPLLQWDLRRCGRTLCGGHHGDRTECRHVLIADVRDIAGAARRRMSADRPSYRLIMIGVEAGAERAHLLTHGCAEVLAAETGLGELEVRARRVADMFNQLPRWRSVGPLTLDLFHRDARCCGARWLVLHPREFGVLWRLSDVTGAVVTRRELLHDVWRISQDPETNSVEVHISRLRSKLAAAGCPTLIETAPQGGYRLAPPQPFMLAGRRWPEGDTLERYSAATASPSRSRSR